MRKTLFLLLAFTLCSLSCTKEKTDNPTPDPIVPPSDFEALKQEVEQLKLQVAALTPGEPANVVTVEEFNALKQENEQLKAQVNLLTSGFFEVEGLRFDRNGTLISVPKIENEESHKVGERTLTTTRTYDTQGRLIQIYSLYSGGNSLQAGSPYNWQKIIYEYSGMKCKTITQTSKYGLPAGTPYEEEITEVTYW